MNETFPVKQTKFSNGEISPALYGDVLHPKYGASLKTCLNWIPTPQGALVKRPGFKFVAPVKDNTYTPRLVKFFFSDQQAWLVELGNLYARFYRKGQYVGNDGNLHTYGDAYAGGYYEIVTPFTTAMLPYLKFAQVGDTITICYGGQVAGVAALAPRDLVHTSNANTPWTLSATPLKIPVTSVPPAPSVSIFAWSNIVTYKVGDFVSQNNVLWMSIQGNNLNNSPPAVALNAAQTGLQGNLWWTPAIDQAHPAVTVNWVLTSVVQDPNGVTYETGPSAVLTGTGPLSTDRQPPLVTTLGLTPALPAGWTELYRKLYRAPQSGNYGWIANIGTGVVIYYDDGRTPDYTKQPPQATDPFLANGADSYPSVVGYLDQRRLFAASALLPSALVLSRVGDLYNWDGSTRALVPGADSDAMSLTLASEVLEQVRSFIPMRRGLILTAQGEWAIAGATGGPVSRSSYDIKRQSTWGSSWLNPIRIGTGVLFNTAKSNMVRDLYPLYGLYADIWDGQDLSVMARHLLDLHTLRDWDFQSVPYPVVWPVRDDGTMLSLTYQHAPPSFGQQLTEGIVAWAQHTTGAGGLDDFEAVCVVPEPPDDAVYAIVKRVFNGATHRFIERMDNPICAASPYVSGVSDVRYGRYLDCSVTYDGHNDQLGFNVNASATSLSHPGNLAFVWYVAGSQIVITIAGGATPFVAGDAAQPYPSAFVFDPEGTLGIGPIKAHVIGFTDSSHVTAELDQNLTQAQINAINAGVAKWAIAKGSVLATHLLGYVVGDGQVDGQRGVMCLADGDVQVPAAWVGGSVGLTVPAVVITTGIDYNSDFVLLDATHAQAEIRNRFKNVLRIGFEVAFARDLWLGKDLDTLSQWRQRQVKDAYGVIQPETGYFEEFVKGEWNKGAQGAVRHFTPLPCTVASVLREIRLGDT